MESAQRELVRILLEHIWSLGLISNSTYSGAMDLVHSAMDFPDFFQCPVRLPKEVDEYEYPQDTK